MSEPPFDHINPRTGKPAGHPLPHRQGYGGGGPVGRQRPITVWCGYCKQSYPVDQAWVRRFIAAHRTSLSFDIAGGRLSPKEIRSSRAWLEEKERELTQRVRDTADLVAACTCSIEALPCECDHTADSHLPRHDQPPHTEGYVCPVHGVYGPCRSCQRCEGFTPRKPKPKPKPKKPRQDPAETDAYIHLLFHLHGQAHGHDSHGRRVPGRPDRSSDYQPHTHPELHIPKAV